MAHNAITTNRSRLDIEEEAKSFRLKFGECPNTCVDILRLVELKLHKAYPSFQFRILPNDKMVEACGNAIEAVTDLSVPSISVSESTYEKLLIDDPRARMTLAHEVGHLFLHYGERDKLSELHRTQPENYNQKTTFEFATSSVEWQANVFASCLLMPVEGVRNLENLEDVMLQFQVSREAAKIRFLSKEVGKKRKIPGRILNKINAFRRNQGFSELR